MISAPRHHVTCNFDLPPTESDYWPKGVTWEAFQAGVDPARSAHFQKVDELVGPYVWKAGPKSERKEKEKE